MPRNRAVDYPQVHRPTAQPQLGLAPPQQPWANDPSRFSWQQTPTEAVSPDADQQLEAGLAARRHLQGNGQAQEDRKSSIPPLPVLPDHLGGRQEPTPQENPLPSQRRGQFQTPEQLLAAQQQRHPQQRNTQFRPDIPRHFQQAQTQSPTPTYEQSQAAYEAKMQEQARYHETREHSQAQLSSPALPVEQQQHYAEPEPEHQSQEEKPSQPEADAQPQFRKTVLVRPDANPLSPTTPRSAVTSPVYSTNMKSFPPTSDMHFSQPTIQTQHTATRGGTWQHGLGSCADPTTCLSSLFCPCVIYGRTQYRLSLKSSPQDPTNMLGYSSINGSCLAWTMLPGVNILLTAIQRTRVRKTYEMDPAAGNVANDCVKSLCCCCCVLAQDEKEMKAREEGKVSPGMEGYKSPGEMTFAAPPR